MNDGENAVIPLCFYILLNFQMEMVGIRILVSLSKGLAPSVGIVCALFIPAREEADRADSVRSLSFPWQHFERAN